MLTTRLCSYPACRQPLSVTGGYVISGHFEAHFKCLARWAAELANPQTGYGPPPASLREQILLVEQALGAGAKEPG